MNAWLMWAGATLALYGLWCLGEKFIAAWRWVDEEVDMQRRAALIKALEQHDDE